MKFRAAMQDPQYMREFQDIILTLSKLCKECVLNISTDKMHFIANEESGTAAPLVWLEVAELYFNKYSMEGVNGESPHIMLSLSPLSLARALGAQRHNVQQFKIKLTNIQFPCLSVETDTVSQTSEKGRKITHDVPVNVIPRKDWPVYALPQIPKSKLVLNVPSNRLMRGLIDKLKNLSPTLIFYATSRGEMNLVVETDMATITTRYRSLEVCVLNPTKEDEAKEQIEASCAVDCKKASLFFSALQVPALELSCGIDDERSIHMEVNVRDGIAIHSILPALSV